MRVHMLSKINQYKEISLKKQFFQAIKFTAKI